MSFNEKPEGHYFYVLDIERANGMLEWLFSLVGDVEKIEFENYKNSSKGVAAVEMRNHIQVNGCVDRFQGKSFLGQKLLLTHRRPEGYRKNEKNHMNFEQGFYESNN